MRSASRRHGRLGSLVAAALLCTAFGTTATAQVQDVPFDSASAERFLAGVAPQDRAYLVNTGARWILPRRDTRPDFKADRSYVYLQFERALSADERGEFSRAGVRFYDAIQRSTYLARINSNQVELLRAHPLFRGMEQVAPVDKLQGSLYAGTPSLHALRPDGSAEVYVRFQEDVQLEHALAVLDRWQVNVADRSRLLFNEKLLVIATHGQILALAEEPAVRQVREIPSPAKDDNLVAATLSNIDDIRNAPFNLTGTDVRIGQWESGNPLTNHADLTGRITVVENNGDSDHGTHVAGTMIGDGTGNASALGMAVAAAIWSYTSGGDPSGEHADSVANEDIDITNNSWGRNTGWDQGTDQGDEGDFGLYDGEAGDWDDVVRDTGLIIHKSAGNDRFECDPTDATNCDGDQGADGEWYDCIPTFGVSKNLITVGALNDDGTLSNFSSTGPANDGRVKPDVVANGVGLFSCWAGNVTLNIMGCTGAAYCSISGTSMSTPTTTGAVALLVDLYRQEYGGITPGPDEIKALLVNTAADLGRPGPDYQFGHGLVDALAAAQTIQVGQVRILTDSVDQDDVDVYLLASRPGQTELRVTLNWIDPPGSANSGDPDLINNLDVRLISPGGTSFWPFTGPQGDPTLNATATGPNSIDTVEHVRVAMPQTGYWTVRVRGIDVPDGPQAYALVANSAFYLGDQPNIDVAANLNFPPTCVDGGLEKQTVRIFNTGGANLIVHNVSVTLGQADFQVLPNPSPPFILPPGAHIDVIVAFDPSVPGLRTGTLQILSNDPDEGTIELPMSGLGGAEDVAASIDSKGYFGLVPLNYQQSKELQVINQGICDLTVVGLQHAMGSTEFSPGEIVGFPAFPFTLFPGESAVIYVTYLPTNFGFDNAVFNLVTSDPDHPQIPVALSGECPPPDISTTGSLRFGEVCADELVEKTIDICNTGLSDLLVTSVAFDPPCDDFTIINNPFPNTVSHDFCLSVTVRYTPTGVGTHSCILRIDSNDPDEPTVTVQATGTLLPVSLDVSPDLCFPPTVTQGLGDCETALPFPVTNTGECPVTITEFNIIQGLNEYSVRHLPTLPVTLLPGEQLGDGILEIVFKPLLVDRYREAVVEVTYITNDPTLGDTETITRNLVGEGVNTGLRMVVRQNGVPIPTVDRIQLFRILYPDTVDETLQIIQIDTHQDLQYTEDTPTCPAVPFHQEYGGETNPITLQPGEYLLWVEHNFGAGIQIRKERVTLDDWCDFEADIALDY